MDSQRIRILSLLSGLDIKRKLEREPYTSFHITWYRGDQKDLLVEHVAVFYSWFSEEAMAAVQTIVHFEGRALGSVSVASHDTITKEKFENYWERFKDKEGLDDEFPSPYQ